MASADLLGDKWTLLILRELFLGTTRFNQFQRALPRMSPTILSKRLKVLEKADIIVRRSVLTKQAPEYRLTRSGRELGPILEGMAIWGLRWRSRSILAKDYDVGGFMWDFHRTLKTESLPDGETVFQVQITDRTDLNQWWVIAKDDVVDLCPEDPGHDVDVYITASFEHLIAFWMGDLRIHDAIAAKAVYLDGPRHLVSSVQDWIPLSPLVDVRPANQTPSLQEDRHLLKL